MTARRRHRPNKKPCKTRRLSASALRSPSPAHRVLWLVAGLLGLLGVAHAHEFRPARVEVTTDPPAILWVAEADQMGHRRPTLRLEGCSPVAEPATDPLVALAGGGAPAQQIIRARFTCPAPPSALVVADLPAELRVIAVAGAQTAVLDATTPRMVLHGAALASWRAFVPVGIEHILTGFDHLLFVLGFVLLVGPRRRLLLALSGFTLGHSLTLAAATLGWVHVPQAPVEAVIALSVVFLAAESLRHRPTLTRQQPALAAVSFGLLHGLGFASALAALLPPEGGVLGPLVGFNLGVELGQILCVLAALGVVALARRTPLPLPLARTAVAWTIGVLAAYWVWERTATLLGA